MDVLRIVGGEKLSGTVDVPGSKNAALAILSTVLLAEEPVRLNNVPKITDVEAKLRLLEQFGVRAEWQGSSLLLDCSAVHHAEPTESEVRPIRTSFYVLGPLLRRIGRAVLPSPGGCKIGARPVDYHVKGLRKLGATIELEGGNYVAKNGQMRGAEIYFDFPSAGATQHVMATATTTPGQTVIENAAMEPEVVTLAAFLNRLGARIEGAGTSTITITGVQRLGGCEFNVPPDRLQAGTFLMAGAFPGNDVTVRGVLPTHQTAVANKLSEAGVEITEGSDWVRARHVGQLKPLRIKTMPYPGFPTDMQQTFAALLSLADGVSVIEETIYESRIGHVDELNRMGARIQVDGRASLIEGVDGLQGTMVEASDLRAGAALVLAGLVASGETLVRNVHYIDRGYADFESKLQGLGARIERIDRSAWVRKPSERSG